MLVSHRKRFIYTKTAKTAGTSIEVYFEPWCLPPDAPPPVHHRDQFVGATGIVGARGADLGDQRFVNHMPAAAIRAAIGDETWQSYYRFCAIRDPFDKMVSWYFHLRQRSGEGGDPVAGFRRWLADGATLFDRDKYVIDGDIAVDGFIRFERLETDLERTCQRVGVPFEPARLPRLKSRYRQHDVALRDFYDAAAIERVATQFAFELDYFGYAPPT